MAITWRQAFQATCEMAEQGGNWAGCPFPIESHPLVIAGSYGYQHLNGMTRSFELPAKDESIESGIEFVNSWWCPQRGGFVHLFRKNGETFHYIDWDYSQWHTKRLTRAFASFETAEVLDAKAEIKAMDKLHSLIAPHLWNGYVLHGMILETSERSGVTYILRKGRPTIAMVASEHGMKILCCLCLHPVGYYSGTFVGCMVPTDEVISHLILIRADEHLFWRKANQHPVYAWEAGL